MNIAECIKDLDQHFDRINKMLFIPQSELISYMKLVRFIEKVMMVLQPVDKSKLSLNDYQRVLDELKEMVVYKNEAMDSETYQFYAKNFGKLQRLLDGLKEIEDM